MAPTSPTFPHTPDQEGLEAHLERAGQHGHLDFDSLARQGLFVYTVDLETGAVLPAWDQDRVLGAGDFDKAHGTADRKEASP